MSLSLAARLALACGISAVAAKSAGSQEVQDSQLAFTNHSIHVPGDHSSSPLSLALKGAGWASSGSVLGAAAGLVADQIYCEQHHGKEAKDAFGPCTLYAGQGFAAGWFGGAIIGAMVGTVSVATRRGCSRREALLRTFAGAALAVAPGVSIVAGRPGKYPPSRSAVIAGTPVLAGLFAAAAVAGCG